MCKETKEFKEYKHCVQQYFYSGPLVVFLDTSSSWMCEALFLVEEMWIAIWLKYGLQATGTWLFIWACISFLLSCYSSSGIEDGKRQSYSLCRVLVSFMCWKGKSPWLSACDPRSFWHLWLWEETAERESPARKLSPQFRYFLGIFLAWKNIEPCYLCLLSRLISAAWKETRTLEDRSAWPSLPSRTNSFIFAI